MGRYRVLGFYLRIDIDPDGAVATLFDPDDVHESMPIAEASAANADSAVSALFNSITFDTDTTED